VDTLVLEVRDAFTGLGLPHAAGGVTLVADTPSSITSIAPFAGQGKAVSDGLKPLGATALPKVGASTKGKGVGLWWVGAGQWMAMGGKAADIMAALEGKAAVVDLSDGWVVFRISGAGARNVFARLCPLDSDPSVMPVGHVARSEYAHLMAIVHVVDDGFQVLVMRSFLKTAIESTIQAIDMLAAEAQVRA